MDTHLKTGSRIHIGLVRKTNQDRVLLKKTPCGLLMVIADGMGGEKGGEEAAEMVIRAMTGFAPKGSPHNELLRCIHNANQDVIEFSGADEKNFGMGSTVVAAFIKGKNLYWLNLGDSRLYLFRKNELIQITTDHNFIQELVDEGDVTPEEALKSPMRHALERAVGIPDDRPPETGHLPLEKGDIILLCSDGLYSMTGDQQMATILASDRPLDEKLDQLLQAALDGGGRDNISIASAEVC